MNLERYRKDAKALVRAFRTGDEQATARAAAVLGERADQRFGLSDAQHIVAVEHGYRTWPDLKRAAEAAQPRELAATVAALEAIRHGDVAGLRALLDERPDLAASELNGPLNLAACFNRAELVRMLLEAGADPAPDPARGLTPLETALYHSSVEAAELIAGQGISPLALWSAAALGRVDLLQSLFGTPKAFAHRPNLSDVGWQPGPPPGDDEQTILDEALCFAALNGRDDAVEWLLERGANVDGAPYLGVTPLHFAVLFGHATTIKLLLARGADTTLRDRIHTGTPAGWARNEGRKDLAGLIEGIDTGLEYVPGEPVRLRVDVHRFPYVDDGGRAVELAGRPEGWAEAARRIADERDVNVSRSGVVSLPIVPAGRGFDAVVERIAHASIELYQDVLELEG